MEGTRADVTEAAWETWDDPAFAEKTKVRWKLIFSGGRTPTGSMSMGIAEIAPGGILPLHRHAPSEMYHVLDGEGVIEIKDVPHRLHPSVSVFIPPDAWHQTVNSGSAPLRFLFVFPTDSFDDVVYQFRK